MGGSARVTGHYGALFQQGEAIFIERGIGLHGGPGQCSHARTKKATYSLACVRTHNHTLTSHTHTHTQNHTLTHLPHRGLRVREPCSATQTYTHKQTHKNNTHKDTIPLVTGNYCLSSPIHLFYFSLFSRHCRLLSSSLFQHMNMSICVCVCVCVCFFLHANV